MASNENEKGQTLPVEDVNKTERKFSQYVPFFISLELECIVESVLVIDAKPIPHIKEIAIVTPQTYQL